MNNDPIYLNWEFWTAIVAATALILSQIPPIYQLVRRAKLTMEVYPKVAIGHKVGYPNMQLGIILSNTGGRQAKVKKITMTVLREGTVVATLPAQLYSPETEPTKQILFAGFKIKPNEDRTHNFNFVMDLQRNQDRELQDKTLALMNDVVSKRAKEPNKDNTVEADLVNVQALHEIMNRAFIWIAGEYVMNIRIESKDAKLYVERTFRFTLYESDSNQLRDFESRYKYGEGIYFGSEKHWLWVKINEG
jgi:hypothetical protein